MHSLIRLCTNKVIVKPTQVRMACIVVYTVIENVSYVPYQLLCRCISIVVSVTLAPNSAYTRRKRLVNKHIPIRGESYSMLAECAVE